MKAKLIRVHEARPGLPHYFTKYELECIECGEHYISGHYDRRTIPYCWECKKKHDKQKALEKKAEQDKIQAELVRKAAAYDRLMEWIGEKGALV